MSQCRGRTPYSLVVTLLMLAGTPALAAGRQTRQNQERAARKACLNGDYGKGVSLLSDLFVDTEDPTYIFNQGRCFEQNLRYEDAVGRFGEYIRAAEASSAGLAPDDRASAEKHIANCKSLLAEQAGKMSISTAPQPFAPPPLSPVSPAAKGRQPSEPSSEAPVTAESAPEHSQTSGGSGLRTVGIVTASFGAAAVATGIVLNLRANSMADSMENDIGAYSPSKNSSRQTYENFAWVSYGVGAACLVTGTVLFGLGLRSNARPSTNVALVPTVGMGQAGVSVTGRFQ